MKPEAAWEELARSGVPYSSHRVDASHPADLFFAVGPDLQPGLVLVTSGEAPPSPGFEAVEVTSRSRADGRWALGIWLRRSDLQPVFAQLCEDLVASSRQVPNPDLARFLLVRLDRWRRLLEAGSQLMSPAEVRGLTGELLVMQRCMEHWPVADVVAGWIGPAESPQDFRLPGCRIEVKTTFPAARTVRITSLDQLDVVDPMLLAVVTLTTMVEAGLTVTLPSVIERTRALITEQGTESDLERFDDLLATTPYRIDPAYERLHLRVDAIDFYRVDGEFPVIRRADVDLGIAAATYDLLLASIAGTRTTLGPPS